MTKIRDLFNKNQAEKLMEARVGLLEKGIYPFDVFLKEHQEAINTAGSIESLELLAESYAQSVPTLRMFVSQNAQVLMESANNTEGVQAAMINYAFLAESIGSCVGEAAKIFATKHQSGSSLKQIYGNDASQLLEFCLRKAESHKLMEGDTGAVIKNLANELATLPIGILNKLCEGVPTIRLYVSNSTHKELATLLAS